MEMISEYNRRERKRLGLSVEYVARECGVTNDKIDEIEENKWTRGTATDDFNRALLIRLLSLLQDEESHQNVMYGKKAAKLQGEVTSFELERDISHKFIVKLKFGADAGNHALYVKGFGGTPHLALAHVSLILGEALRLVGDDSTAGVYYVGENMNPLTT
ncbi:hypothetical protein ACXIUS_28875 [Bosea thiooxidans]